MKFFKVNKYLLGAVLLSALAERAAAADNCTVNGGSSPVVYELNRQDKSEVVFSSSMPNGTVLNGGWVGFNFATQVVVNCQGAMEEVIISRIGGDPVAPGYYSTGIPGIAMLLTLSGDQILPQNAGSRVGGGRDEALNAVRGKSYFVSFLKHDDISASGNVNVNIGFGIDGDNDRFVRANFSMGIRVVDPTCVPSEVSRNIPMGDISLGSFVDNRSAAMDFDIQLLDCTGVSTKVSMGLTDANDHGNTSTQATLVGATEGVALEVNRPGIGPIRFGPLVNNPNAWVVGNTDSGSISVPLSANLVKTQEHVKGGDFSGSVTYSLTYE